MRLPFSYRNHLFKTAFFASLMAHTSILGGLNFFVSAPQYAVERSATSLEVVLTQEPKPEAAKEKILTVAKPDRSETIVPKPQEPKEKKPLPSRSPRGAVQEIKPAYLKNPAPIYPNAARENGWQGTVILRVSVDRSGFSSSVAVEKSSGYPVLDDSAVKAVRHWQFLPARAAGLAFASQIRIPVRFVLTDGD